MNRTIKLSRNATYVITIAVIFGIVEATWHCLSVYFGFNTKEPTPAGRIVGLLAAGVIYRAAMFFEETTAKHVAHYMGYAFAAQSVAYASEYLHIGIPRLVLCALTLGSGFLGLYGCVAHLRYVAQGEIRAGQP